MLDLDIKGFFDGISHPWLVKFVEHRIADRRVVRLIQKWLSAGVLEDGKHLRVEEGTPQGGSASPLLANIYLHYVFDLWVQAWREKLATGDLVVVRYADDLVVGFENRAEAERFRKDFRERLAKFGLELHPEKTRLIEFGRTAEFNRKQRGEGKPETFTFLGFTHHCGKTRKGRFTIWRKTAGKRLRAKLESIQQELQRRMHEPVGRVGEWLHRVVNGLLPLSRCARKLRQSRRFPAEVMPAVGAGVTAPQSEAPPELGSPQLSVRRMAALSPHLHPYPSARFDATHPR